MLTPLLLYHICLSRYNDIKFWLCIFKLVNLSSEAISHYKIVVSVRYMVVGKVEFMVEVITLLVGGNKCR